MHFLAADEMVRNDDVTIGKLRHPRGAQHSKAVSKTGLATRDNL
jgi:hypothetical protein